MEFMTVDHIFVAVDGGNSKTDVILADTAGVVLARRRGPGSSPHLIGVGGAIRLVGGLIEDARAEAGLPPGSVLDRAEIYLAGADLPVEVERLSEAVIEAGWAHASRVDNDTLALMRAGTDARDAVAVVCGAGINCIGRARTGAVARFPALGTFTGDWGGGLRLAELALWHAARGEDGRGPRTELTAAVREHFAADSVEAIGIGLHLGEILRDRLVELTPLLFQAAEMGDGVAQKVVLRQAREIVALAGIAASRLEMKGDGAVVVLGGGILTARHPLLHGAVIEGLRDRLPLAEVTVSQVPPVAGAALLGLDALGASEDTKAALRKHFA